MNSQELNNVIVCAKAASYIGGGSKQPSERPGSNEIAWSEGEWRYLDSYFGSSDFLGQEVLWFRQEPIWAMNYYGYIKRPDLIDGAKAGAIIKGALSALYREGRFLGGHVWTCSEGTYRDKNDGGLEQFRGREVILVNGVEAYALEYFGGLVKA